MQAVIQYILDLGAAIFLPIIMIILGLAMGMKLKKAIISGITLGIAFTGMGVVLGFMFTTISPVAQQFVERTGLQLNTIDVGWSPMAAIAWAWPFAIFMFPIQIGINLLMIAIRQTDVLNVDLWNVWGKILTATMVAAITGSVALGFVAASIQVVVELKVGGATQHRVQKLTGIPGVACAHQLTLQCAIMDPVNSLLDKLPFIKDTNMDANKLKNKIGIFGENSVMGLIVGAGLSIFAGYSFKESANVAIKIASALVLFPMVAKLFMQALQPISDTASEFMKKKFKDREIFIGLDWPILAGRSEMWVVGILIIPLELLFALLFAKLGWSNVLPLASIINLGVIVSALIVTNGNLIKMIILSIIFTPTYLLVSSAFAQAATDLAKIVGTIDIPTGQLITYFGVEAPVFRWAISESLNVNVLAIGILVVFTICLVLYVRKMKKEKLQEK